MKISENLVNAIKLRKSTQKELAQNIGVPTSTVNNWIRLDRSIPAEQIIPICEFLRISPYLLLTGSETISPVETVTIGSQSPTITNSNNVEVNGVKHTSGTGSLPETTEELIRIYDQLPIKEKIRLMNLIYDYVEKYQHESVE